MKQFWFNSYCINCSSSARVFHDLMYFELRLSNFLMTPEIQICAFCFFSSPGHEVLRVSYCDHSPSVVCLSVVRSHFLVYTLASTNINQSPPNLVQMYMTIRAGMSSIMEHIRLELSELSALEYEKLPDLTLFTL